MSFHIFNLGAVSIFGYEEIINILYIIINRPISEERMLYIELS